MATWAECEATLRQTWREAPCPAREALARLLDYCVEQAAAHHSTVCGCGLCLGIEIAREALKHHCRGYTTGGA